MTTLSQFYDIFVFTKLKKSLSIPIVSSLDSRKNIILGVLSRKKCFRTWMGLFLNFLVDSESFSFCFQIDNGVPIMPWNGDSKDSEILHLTGYLIKLSHAEDVRVMNRERFRLRELAKMTVRELAEML